MHPRVSVNNRLKFLKDDLIFLFEFSRKILPFLLIKESARKQFQDELIAANNTFGDIHRNFTAEKYENLVEECDKLSQAIEELFKYVAAILHQQIGSSFSGEKALNATSGLAVRIAEQQHADSQYRAAKQRLEDHQRKAQHVTVYLLNDLLKNEARKKLILSSQLLKLAKPKRQVI